MANPQTGTARFEMQQLAQVSQEAAKMVEGMNVGEISKPFTMINAKGKEICAIVKLKTRLNGEFSNISLSRISLNFLIMLGNLDLTSLMLDAKSDSKFASVMISCSRRL